MKPLSRKNRPSRKAERLLMNTKTETKPTRRTKLADCEVGDYVFVQDAERFPDKIKVIQYAVNTSLDFIPSESEIGELRELSVIPMVFRRSSRYEPNGERVDVWAREA